MCLHFMYIRVEQHFFDFQKNSLVIMNFTKKHEYLPFIVLLSTVTGTSVCLSQPIIGTSARGTCDSLSGV